MKAASVSTLHQRYFDLVEAIESELRVAGWRAADIDLWPMARQDLFLDMFRREIGETAPARRAFPIRAGTSLATPLINFWKSRHDLVHWMPRPRRADAILLGDGVSLDRIDGAWQDRYGEPIAAALERQGRSSFPMQPGNLSRLPWVRPTFAANTIAARAAVAGTLARNPPLDLPDHTAVLRLVARSGVAAPSLSRTRLARRARMTGAQAAAFGRVLRAVRPKLAFVVTYYAGLGHAFALACRRHEVLCADLQHCPQDGGHRAYRWWSLPPDGYSTLPGLFWTWTEADAARIGDWTGSLDRPWHRAIHGGHTQITAFREARSESARKWDAAFEAPGGGYAREILVALQPIGGQRARWEALAAQIEAAPPEWRWWIRRHPASTASQDAEYACLLSPGRPNVVVEGASQLPLPALMDRMSVLVSLASGAAGEAAEFGVPALFLSPEALGPFAGLIARGHAALVETDGLVGEIARLPARPPGPRASRGPVIEETLRELDRIAEDYALLCRKNAKRAPLT